MDTNLFKLQVEIIPEENYRPLAFGTSKSAAVDLGASIDKAITLKPGESESISAGFKMCMKPPAGMKAVALIFPRSGLGSKGIHLLNVTGVIDEDYHGTVTLKVVNEGKEDFTIEPKDRIMQMAFIPVFDVEFTLVESFSVESERGEGGFNSTGTK